MDQNAFNQLRKELSIKAKNGIDFMVAASIIWAIISVIWAQDDISYQKSIYTFIVGGAMLPLAFGLSKVFKTTWKVEHNPLDPLGLWFNFAQLFYFPFLIFFLLKWPDYFLMGYVIITGAHFFPYAWYYQESGYAILAGVIPIGSLLIALLMPVSQFYLIGVFMVICLLVLAAWLYLSYRSKAKTDPSTDLQGP